MDYIKPKALAVLDFELDSTKTTPKLVLDLQSLPCIEGAPPLEGCVLDYALTAEECDRLVAAAESSDGFAFWDPSSDVTSRKRNSSVRNADTLEFEDDAFCAALWERLAPHVPNHMHFTPDDDDERYEPDLDGEWAATGLNPHLLINRYASGGHFAPHADGSTMVNFNQRSLYTVLLYLNDCPEGGATQLLSSAGGETSQVDEHGARVAKPEAVVHAVRPDVGRALMYYHQVLHAGETVGRGCRKYCLRTDVMYERTEHRGTSPNDVKAYDLVMQAVRSRTPCDIHSCLPAHAAEPCCPLKGGLCFPRSHILHIARCVPLLAARPRGSRTADGGAAPLHARQEAVAGDSGSLSDHVRKASFFNSRACHAHDCNL